MTRTRHRHDADDEERFLERVQPDPAALVVEAGCGRGGLTARLAAIVTSGRVIAVDPDPQRLEEARTQAPDNVEFRHGRLPELDFVCAPASADLVVSRGVLHWVPLPEHRRCYEAIHRVLKPGGWFHAQARGAGDLTRVGEVLEEAARAHRLRPAPATLPDAGLVFDLLEAAGFTVPAGGVSAVAQRQTFDRDGLLAFLRARASTGYVAAAPPDRRAVFLSDLERWVERLRRADGSYDQTVVCLDVLARRPPTPPR